MQNANPPSAGNDGALYVSAQAATFVAEMFALSQTFYIEVSIPSKTMFMDLYDRPLVDVDNRYMRVAG
jgi:hypothetical protein